MKIRFAFLLVVLAVQSCKREPYPAPMVDTPQFTMSGQLNGEAFNWQAGVNDLYLTSLLDQNEFGVYEFSSSFDQTTCSGCDPVFTLTINDITPLAPNAPAVSDVLDVSTLNFATVNTSSNFRTINFFTPYSPDLSYQWSFGDGGSSDENNPQHTYSVSGTYNVILQIQSVFSTSCNISIEQTVFVGTNQYLSVPFDVIPGPGNNIQLYYLPSLPPHLQPVYWLINSDSYQGDGLLYPVDSWSDALEVCLNYYNTSTQEYGQYCVRYNDGLQSGQCLPIIYYQWEPAVINLNNVKFFYRDSSGARYNSITTLNANSNTILEILNVEDYLPGIDGRSAKKVSVRFNAWLAKEDNPIETIYMENVIAYLAFIY